VSNRKQFRLAGYETYAQTYDERLYASAHDGTFPSIDAEGNCRYCGPGGTRCAVGLLIIDKAYRKGLAGVNVRHFFEEDMLDVPEGLDL
jgi:hypothetical protein